MVRSYNVLYSGGNDPWLLYLYEGIDLLDVMRFSLYDDARVAGEKFLDGYYVSLKVAV